MGDREANPDIRLVLTLSECPPPRNTVPSTRSCTGLCAERVARIGIAQEHFARVIPREAEEAPSLRPEDVSTSLDMTIRWPRFPDRADCNERPPIHSRHRGRVRDHRSEDARAEGAGQFYRMFSTRSAFRIQRQPITSPDVSTHLRRG